VTEKPKLRAHQVDGVRFLDSQDLGVLVVDRGAGKTAMTMASLSHKLAEKKVHRILYCAPLSTLVNVEREVYRFGTGLRAQVVAGPRRKRAKAIQNPHDKNVDIISTRRTSNTLSGSSTQSSFAARKQCGAILDSNSPRLR